MSHAHIVVVVAAVVVVVVVVVGDSGGVDDADVDAEVDDTAVAVAAVYELDSAFCLSCCCYRCAESRQMLRTYRQHY